MHLIKTTVQKKCIKIFKRWKIPLLWMLDHSFAFVSSVLVSMMATQPQASCFLFLKFRFHCRGILFLCHPFSVSDFHCNIL